MSTQQNKLKYNYFVLYGFNLPIEVLITILHIFNFLINIKV